MPEVSVVVPLYNKQRCIGRCVESIRRQTFHDFEVIVVDDGSTDGSFEVFRSAVEGDARFRLIRQTNAGVSRARNAAIELANAEIVAFLDADDEWKPEYLEAIVSLARANPDAVLLGTGYEILQGCADLHLRRDLFGGSRKADILGFFAAWARLGGCPLFIGATAARRQDLSAIGGFEVGMNLGEELLAFIRLSERGPIVFDDRPLAVYHLGREGTLATSPSRSAIRAHEKLLIELRRQTTSGRCPGSVYRRWMAIHAGYLMRAGQRSELLRFMLQAPGQFESRVWIATILEVMGVRYALRKFLGRA